jgi:ATP-dependent DNA helicase DinG
VTGACATSVAGQADYLSPGGRLAAALDGYEDRPGQRQMAEAVARALAEDTALLVEAGTGTGKTLAYLAPAIASGRRVVISTGTRTLQDQLANTDVPILERMLGRRVAAVTLKGVSNYLCRRKYQRAIVRGIATASASAALERIAAWVQDTESGDRGELAALADGDAIWEEVTTDAEGRLGPRCPHYDSCFVTRARRRADEAELVLVNHHLFFADLALRGERGGARVLPAYEAVIFDEAHQLEEVITEHFGVALSSVAIARLARDLREQLGARRGSKATFGRDGAAELMASQLELAAARLWRRAHDALCAGAPPTASRLPLPPEALTGDHGEAYLAVDTALEAIEAHATLRASEACADPDREEEAEHADSIARRARRHRDALALLAERPDDDLGDFAYWGQLRGERVFLGAAPIDVSHVLRERLLPQAPAVVLTSATISAGGDFSYTRERLGLDEEIADELSVDSPFDFGSQALLYVPRDLPEPASPTFFAACAKRIAELAAITEGRALALFTSHRALRDVAARLRRDARFELLVQGEAPRGHLLDAFRARDGAILCATGSFWEGIDLPGDDLSLLVIDKLPFSPPGDPMAAARIRALERRDLDPFTAYQLPRAAIALKQGIGRLIRRRDDRGIAAVLDRRLVSRGYGKVLFDSLPRELGRTSNLERLRRWWDGLE